MAFEAERLSAGMGSFLFTHSSRRLRRGLTQALGRTGMSGFLKRLVLGLGKAVVAILLVFLVFAAYGFYAEDSAKKKAAAMCASIKPGQDASLLLDRAVADGASDSQTRWGNVNEVDTLFITYVGLPPFSRHICLVDAKDGRVLSTREGRLD